MKNHAYILGQRSIRNLCDRNKYSFLTNFGSKDVKQAFWIRLEWNQFLQQIETSSTFLRAKQVGEKRGKFQLAVEIAHKAVILILLSL